MDVALWRTGRGRRLANAAKMVVRRPTSRVPWMLQRSTSAAPGRVLPRCPSETVAGRKGPGQHPAKAVLVGARRPTPRCAPSAVLSESPRGVATVLGMRSVVGAPTASGPSTWRSVGCGAHGGVVGGLVGVGWSRGPCKRGSRPHPVCRSTTVRHSRDSRRWPVVDPVVGRSGSSTPRGLR